MEEIITFAEKEGLVVSKEAVKILENKNWKRVLKEMAKEGTFIVDEKQLEKKLTTLYLRPAMRLTKTVRHFRKVFLSIAPLKSPQRAAISNSSPYF